jgi:hypothetical protein
VGFRSLGIGYTLNFEAGEYKKSIIIEVIDNNISETDEQVFFILNNPVGAELGGSNTAYLNIVDNEANEAVVFAMRDSDIAVNREDGTAVVTIERVSGAAKFASVVVSTAAIDAKPETDYTPIETEIVFAQGVTERTLEIPLLGGTGQKDGVQFAVFLEPESAYIKPGAEQTIVTLHSPEVMHTLGVYDSENNDGGEASLSDAGWTQTEYSGRSGYAQVSSGS